MATTTIKPGDEVERDEGDRVYRGRVLYVVPGHAPLVVADWRIGNGKFQAVFQGGVAAQACRLVKP